MSEDRYRGLVLKTMTVSVCVMSEEKYRGLVLKNITVSCVLFLRRDTEIWN